MRKDPEGGHTPHYYDLKEKMMEDFAELGVYYLTSLSKENRKLLYNFMNVKTPSEALYKRLYYKYFKDE